MLPSRRIASSTACQFIHNTARQSSLVSIPISRRFYAAVVGPQPKLDPLSEPIPGELDPRFSDLPPWNVPPVNRQTLTETPAQPYYDQQGRRYFGEPVTPPPTFFSKNVLNMGS
jgi:hypothetical protein